ncbi:MAG: glycine cleavage system protein GcvH [Methylotetracoccus sp.]
MSDIPAELKYAKTHEWARSEPDGTIRVGITDHAQQQLGDVVYVELPEVGRQIRSGEACAVIESVKAASDIYSPVSGEIVAANSALADTPEGINLDPYGTWLFSVRGTDPGADLATLLNDAGYRAIIEESA